MQSTELQITADLLTHNVFPLPLLRPNYKQANHNAILA